MVRYVKPDAVMFALLIVTVAAIKYVKKTYVKRPAQTKIPAKMVRSVTKADVDHVPMMRIVEKPRSAKKVNVSQGVEKMHNAPKNRSVKPKFASKPLAPNPNHVAMVRSVKMAAVKVVPKMQSVANSRSAKMAIASKVAATIKTVQRAYFVIRSIQNVSNV
jgi:hypothetical protein